MAAGLDTKSDIVRGKLLKQSEGSDAKLVLAIPGTNYQIHLKVDQPVQPDVFNQVAGRITAQARRMDKVETGGRYVEPCYGRPRRVQGRVTASDEQANTVTVFAGLPLIVTPLAPQTASDFAEGDFVSFDVESGATFHPAT